MKILLSLFLFSNLCFSQNNSWTRLNKSAHAIGFCIYNINESYCNQHKVSLDKYKKEAKDKEEVYYFLMKEDWAKKRVTEWAKQQQNNSNTQILIFDINQGFKHRNKNNSKKINNRFYIVDIEDELTLKIGHKGNSISISHNKPNMLENSLWREFISGRLRLVKKKVELNAFAKSKPKKRQLLFKKTTKRGIAN